MTPELIIGIVSAIIGVGFVKYWLYKLIKYKMDEGIVLHFFDGKEQGLSASIEAISAEVDLDYSRVEKICQNSALFELTGTECRLA